MIYSGAAGTETTHYASRSFEKVITSSGTDYRHYLYAGNRPVALLSRNTAGVVNNRSLLADHEGSISEMTTTAGALYIAESFDAFGNRRDANTWSGAPAGADRTTMDGTTRQGYTFQTWLGSMGLNHMNGRVQDSITGRFLSADPNISDPTNTQSHNRYSYLNNNPLSYGDPTGFQQVNLV
jgi:RHS repeat-associated protein